MRKGDDGVWSITLGPVAPGIYDYVFDVDGLQITDPASPNVFGNRQGTRGYVEVPGPPGKPRHDQWRDVPHGSVTVHWYVTTVTESTGGGCTSIRRRPTRRSRQRSFPCCTCFTAAATTTRTGCGWGGRT